MSINRCNYGKEKGCIVSDISKYTQKQMANMPPCHDFLHVLRVRDTARHIARNISESVDMFIIDLTTTLHDISDHKFSEINSISIESVMRSYGCKNNDIIKVVEIIENLSYSTGQTPKTLEGRIVQDADRLDSIGAIGIARTFSYGSYAGNPFYSDSPEKPTTIGHFDDKLLLLKDRFHTQPARRLAEKRHEFLIEFLVRFKTELNVK